MKMSEQRPTIELSRLIIKLFIERVIYKRLTLKLTSRLVNELTSLDLQPYSMHKKSHPIPVHLSNYLNTSDAKTISYLNK